MQARPGKVCSLIKIQMQVASSDQFCSESNILVILFVLLKIELVLDSSRYVCVEICSL